MTAVDVAKLLGGRAEFGEEERRVAIPGSGSEEETVRVLQEPGRIVVRPGVLTPQRRLQVRHEQRGRDALAGDVGQHQGDPIHSHLDEVVVVAADRLRLYALRGARETRQLRHALRQQLPLHLLGYLHLLLGPPFGLDAGRHFLAQTDGLDRQGGLQGNDCQESHVLGGIRLFRLPLSQHDQPDETFVAIDHRHETLRPQGGEHAVQVVGRPVDTGRGQDSGPGRAGQFSESRGFQRQGAGTCRQVGVHQPALRIFDVDGQ